MSSWMTVRNSAQQSRWLIELRRSRVEPERLYPEANSLQVDATTGDGNPASIQQDISPVPVEGWKPF
jgi:hypothetical protein